MGNAKLKVVLTVIMLAFAIIPALVVGTVGTFSVMGFENSAKMDTLSTVSLSKSAAIEELFSGYVADITALSKMEVAVEAAGGGDDADGIISAMAANNPDYIDVLIIDAKGTVLTSAKGISGGNFEHFNADGMPAVSDVKTWENYNKADALFISKEIYADPDAKTGGKLGYACAVVSLAPESGVVKALQGSFLEGGHMILFDNSGNMINFNADGAVNKNGSADSGFTAKLSELFQLTNSVSAGNNASSNVSGSVGKYAYNVGIIPNITTWRWGGVVDSGSFDSFAGTNVLIGWSVIAVSCAAASLLGLVIASRFIKNMHDMLKTMDEIGSEDGSQKVRFTVKNRKSELGEIMTSFNELLDEVVLSEERHRTIAELSDNMLFEWDFHKERMYVSANTLTKFNIDTENSTLSNGKFIDSLMSQEDGEKYKRDINMLLKNKNGYSAEYQLTAKSGAVIWVSLRAVCITDRL